MIIAKYLLLMSALIEMNVMSTQSVDNIIARRLINKNRNETVICLFNYSMASSLKYLKSDLAEGVKSKDSKENNEYKAVALIGIVGGICLILFRKKIIRDIIKQADNWVKEPAPQQESIGGLKKPEIVRFGTRFFEVGIVVFGILIFAMGLPSFVPILHRPVIIICLSFFFIFIPVVLGTSVLTLILFPLWGWKLRKYRKNRPSIPHQMLFSQPLKDSDDIILQKLQKETNKYGIVCSAILFIICLVIAIKIAFFFNIFK